MRHYLAALLLLILDFILILGIAAMKTTPRDCLLLDEFDYIFISPTRSRKKAGPAIWHAPMILPLASDSSSNSDANIEPNLPPSDSNDDITAMLLDTLESPPGPHRQSPPRSSSPAPVWCEGCDVQAPDGNDDPQEVECEVCKFWSHIACLTREQEDWNDPKVSFVCKCCQAERALDFFTERQIIMMPNPNMPDWKAPKYERTAREYEFEWLECNDETLSHSSDDLDIPPLMLRICYRSRKVCEEINAIQLSAAQIGNVRLPFYLKPDDPEHKNLELEAIFSTAIHHVADILATFDHNHPFVASKKTIDIHREVGDWMRSLCLVPTPELEAVLMERLGNLLKHELLAEMLQTERHRRVMAVGSALFQPLAVHHILGEELSLDGATVVPRSSDGPEALAAMFAAIPLSAAHSGKWAAHMQQFNGAHSFYDPDFCLPTFRGLNGPQVEKKPVPQAPGNKPAKRMKKKDLSSSIPQRKNPRRKPAGSITKPVQVTKSKKKSRHPGYIDIDSDGNEL
ncbi:hypothetical protein B0H14DRAFT_2630627 [Mycena olivaceomarginata]|nr:hypothetical protein B0H14DRAFT_2630627 [Mycena olivaceomarginata]